MTEAIRVTLWCIVSMSLAVGWAGCGGSAEETSPAGRQQPFRGDARPYPEHATTLTIVKDGNRLYHGRVLSGVGECSVERGVVLYEQRRGGDRKLGSTRTGVAPVGADFLGPQLPEKDWAYVPPRWIELRRGARIYARAPREERAGLECSADRSKVLLHGITNE